MSEMKLEKKYVDGVCVIRDKGTIIDLLDLFNDSHMGFSEQLQLQVPTVDTVVCHMEEATNDHNILEINDWAQQLPGNEPEDGWIDVLSFEMDWSDRSPNERVQRIIRMLRRTAQRADRLSTEDKASMIAEAQARLGDCLFAKRTITHAGRYVRLCEMGAPETVKETELLMFAASLAISLYAVRQVGGPKEELRRQL